MSSSRDLQARARALHSSSLVIDALDISIMNREHLQRMHRGGVTAANVCLTLQHGFQETVELIADFDKKLRDWSDLLLPVRTVADIHRAKRENKVGVIYGVQNATPIEGDLRLLGILKSLDLRIIQLTYMTGNLVGDGCLEPRDAGLTLFGKNVIKEMNRLGLLIDLSHCGERTTLEAIAESEQPVAVTHACTRHLCQHPRNKTDEAMKALAANGGVMGITSLAEFVAENRHNADLNRYLDHIDYAVNLMGIEHVGLGLDFVEGQPEDFATPIKWGGTIIPPPGSHLGRPLLSAWPIAYARDIDDSTKLPNITAGLLQRGYEPESVQRILGGNFARLFGEVWRD